MRSEDFEYLYELEEKYWWFVAMRQITDAIVRTDLGNGSKRMLDAGCGTGYNLRHYQDLGHTVYGLDLSSDAVDGVRKRGFNKLAQASVTEIPYKSATFDVVFSFDVVQQLPVTENGKAFSEMHRVLKPGGSLFIRVAAFEWLRSSHDEELHTAHRFTLGELQHDLERAGFKVHLATYANSFLFPVVVARRFLKRIGIGGGTDVKPLPSGLGWIDPIFRNILAAEAGVIRRRMRLPAGLSAICYAEKPH